MTWPNDWKLKTCLHLCGAITVLQLMLMILAQTGLDVPGIRQVTGFIFLTFVPGVLLLRSLRIHNINPIEAASYTVGLSLALLMFTGFVINLAVPLIGIKQPLTLYPVTAVLLLETVLLGLAAWLSDRGHVVPAGRRNNSSPNCNSCLFMLAVLLLVILGVLVNELAGNNILLIVSLLVIAAVIILAAFRQFITPDVYPAALFLISLGLLYQTSLMSPYPVGTDIYTEYQYYNMTATNGIWEYALPNSVNSCLSIVILTPVYSLTAGVSGIWIFKAVYPILFSFVPLILFRAFRLQMGDYRSFLAVFFFMAVPTFSLELIGLCRQQVAELFMALFILLLVDRKIDKRPKLALMMIFSISIAVSHYALGFVTFIYMGLLPIFIWIMRSGWFQRIWAYVTDKTGGLPADIKRPAQGDLSLRAIMIPVVFYFIFAITWYSLIASGINFVELGQRGAIQLHSLIDMTHNLFVQATGSGSPGMAAQTDPLINAALGLDFWQASWQGKIFRILQYVTQIFIVAGFLRLLIMPGGLKFRLGYFALSVSSFILLAACLFLPYFASALNTSRWYHVLLLTLSPFCILGGEVIWSLLKSGWQRLRGKHISADTLTASTGALKYITALVLIPYFVFTAGIIYEVTGQQVTDKVDDPYSIALTSYRIDFTGIFKKTDGASAEWLSGLISKSPVTVYCDINSYKMFKLFVLPTSPVIIGDMSREKTLAAESYLYLTSWNMTKGQFVQATMLRPGLRRYAAISDSPGVESVIEHGNCIYGNGGSTLFINR